MSAVLRKGVARRADPICRFQILNRLQHTSPSCSPAPFALLKIPAKFADTCTCFLRRAFQRHGAVKI